MQILTPLPKQRYIVDLKCVDTWSILTPAAGDGTLADEINAGFSNWKQAFGDWHDHAIVYQDLRTFGRSLSGQDASSRRPNAILTNSHHKLNKIFWDDSENTSIDPDQVQIQFPDTSLAILNGCGTQGPGQSEFVRKFNLRGVSTIIASFYELDGEMAGKFAAHLMQALQDNQHDTNYTIGQAFQTALQQTSVDRPSNGGDAYGAAAYAYSLLGAPNLRVCVPPTPVKNPPAPSQ